MANILNVNKSEIVINGSKTLLLRRPGIASVLLVIKRFVNETVELTPAKITATINKSWLPIFVYFVLFILVESNNTLTLLFFLLLKSNTN